MSLFQLSYTIHHYLLHIANVNIPLSKGSGAVYSRANEVLSPLKALYIEGTNIFMILSRSLQRKLNTLQFLFKNFLLNEILVRTDSKGFFEEKWVLVLPGGQRCRWGVNFLDVLKWRDYEKMIFMDSYVYTHFFVRRGLEGVINQSSWNFSMLW